MENKNPLSVRDQRHCWAIYLVVRVDNETRHRGHQVSRRLDYIQREKREFKIIPDEWMSRGVQVIRL